MVRFYSTPLFKIQFFHPPTEGAVKNRYLKFLHLNGSYTLKTKASQVQVGLTLT